MELFAPESFGFDSCFFILCVQPPLFSLSFQSFFGGGGYALYEICGFI